MELGLAVEFVEGVEHGDNVLRGNVGHEVVDRVEDVAAAGGEDLQTVQHVPAYLRRGGVVEDGAGVRAGTPEGDLRTEFALEGGGIHIGAVGLYRVDNVIADLDEIGQEFVDRAAGVEKDLGRGVRLEVADQPAVPGFEECAVGVRGHEGAGTHAQIIAETEDIDNVAQIGADFIQGLQVKLQQRVEQGLHLFRLGDNIHQKIVYPAQEGTPFKHIAADTHKERPVGLGAQLQAGSPQLFPEIRLSRLVPRALRQIGPEHLLHRLRQLAVVCRVILQIRETGLIVKGSPLRHSGDHGAAAVVDLPVTVIRIDRVEP